MRQKTKIAVGNQLSAFSCTRLPILILSILLFSGGCAPVMHSIRPLPPIHDPAAYFAKVTDNGAAVECLSGLARIKLQAPDRSFSAKCLFFLKRPDKLRIVILDFFNQPALFLVAGNDAGLTMFTPSTNICYGGKATPENMDRAFGIPLSARDILDAVLGPAPETVPADTAFSVDQQDSLYRVSLISAEQRQTLLTEPGRDLLRQYTKAVRNEPLFTCTYAEHKTIDGLLIPSKREIRLPAHDTALSITFTNQSTKQLQAELFTFTPPATAQLLPLARILQPR